MVFGNLIIESENIMQVHTLYIQYFLGQAVKFAPKDEGFDFCEFKGLTNLMPILLQMRAFIFMLRLMVSDELDLRPWRRR